MYTHKYKNIYIYCMYLLKISFYTYIVFHKYCSFASLALFNWLSAPLLLLSNHTPERFTLMISIYIYMHSSMFSSHVHISIYKYICI